MSPFTVKTPWLFLIGNVLNKTLCVWHNRQWAQHFVSGCCWRRGHCWFQKALWVPKCMAKWVGRSQWLFHKGNPASFGQTNQVCASFLSESPKAMRRVSQEVNQGRHCRHRVFWWSPETRGCLFHLRVSGQAAKHTREKLFPPMSSLLKKTHSKLPSQPKRDCEHWSHPKDKSPLFQARCGNSASHQSFK